MIDCVQKKLRALKELKYEPNKLSDVLLINIPVEKLDRESRRNFELSHTSKTVSTFQELIEFVEQRESVLLSVSVDRNAKVNPNKMYANNSKPKAFIAIENKNKNCIVYNGNEKEYCETVNMNSNPNNSASVLSNNTLPDQINKKNVLFSTAETYVRGAKGLGIRDDPVLHERDQALEIFKETVEFEKGRYIVQLLFRKSYNELSDNYPLAKQRFQNLWRRFGHDSELYQQYREIIRDYTEQGHKKRRSLNIKNKNCI
ncbi:uncharacterized protein TNCV_1964151 [Trichonephila clavipes]|nr:uncharacterized protein TNCV_1964151 [Trichonephila clavipes]